jgi:hypothetical protein
VSGIHLGPTTNFWSGAPSLTRGRVCSFQFLLGIASAAFLRSESNGTHEHILLSLFLRLAPTWRASFLYLFPQEQCSPVISPAIGYMSRPELIALLVSVLLDPILNKKKKKLHGLSPRANYTDRATAACRRSDCQLLRIKGAT